MPKLSLVVLGAAHPKIKRNNMRITFNGLKKSMKETKQKV